MFVEERHDKILAYINQDGKVKVKELSKRFGVTDDCIRKDLAAMEKRGLLKRTYGGAVSVDLGNTHPGHSNYVSSRTKMNLEKKQVIARKAVEKIKEGDIIYLDTSTTNVLLAQEILRSGLKIHVVSPMLDIANIFATESSTEFILLGGQYNLSQNSYMGMMTIQMLNNLRFDIAFMGVVGADLENNEITTYMPEDGVMKNEVVKRANQKYLMLECEKFQFRGTYKYTDFDTVNGVICEEQPEREICEALMQHHVKIIE